MDAVGLMGEWGDELDDRWDAATKLDDPVHQQIRTLSSVIIPSLMTGYGTASLIGKIPKMPAMLKMLTTAGAWTLESQIVTGISDTSEDHSLSGALVQMWPGVFDVGGRLPLPEQFITYDEDSPEIRREKTEKKQLYYLLFYHSWWCITDVQSKVKVKLRQKNGMVYA